MTIDKNALLTNSKRGVLHGTAPLPTGRVTFSDECRLKNLVGENMKTPAIVSQLYWNTAISGHFEERKTNLMHLKRCIRWQCHQTRNITKVLLRAQSCCPGRCKVRNLLYRYIYFPEHFVSVTLVRWGLFTTLLQLWYIQCKILFGETFILIKIKGILFLESA